MIQIGRGIFNLANFNGHFWGLVKGIKSSGVLPIVGHAIRGRPGADLFLTNGRRRAFWKPDVFISILRRAGGRCCCRRRCSFCQHFYSKRSHDFVFFSLSLFSVCDQQLWTDAARRRRRCKSYDLKYLFNSIPFDINIVIYIYT